MTDKIAHAYQDSSENWHSHSLQKHLQKVAKLAKRFAGRYGALFAEYAGLLHDLGKFQEAFQKYIRNASGFEKENAHLEDVESTKLRKIPHSTAGAKYAVEHLNPFFGHLLVYLIAGHHAGLADWYDKGSLKSRLQQADDELAASLSGLVESGLSEDFFPVSDNDLKQDFFAFWKDGAKLEELHIWLRFLFSCLVDADFLDTEAFMNGYADADAAQAAGLRPKFPGLDELHQRYEQYMAQLHEKSDKDSFLNQERHAILQQSFSAAETDRTLFSLTVPTGGGKTLASLGFALKHALKFDKKRIIYAIPFTSIIEQNADVFRKALGDDVVLEHHSNLDVKEDKETAKTRLATENWDAPLIVTTNVQLFESLFAAKTSRCRKIHNIADSVVILDEAQNTTSEQMRMFLTRLGFGSKMVVTGDDSQVDLPGGKSSGLIVVSKILPGVDDISFCHLTSADVVRHRLVGDIIDAYSRWDARQAAAVAQNRSRRRTMQTRKA